MNDDAFEEKLCALAAKLERPDPTAAWRTDILARAAQAREKRMPGAQRVLLVMLGTAWLLIAALRITTPSDTSAPSEVRDARAIASQGESPLRMLMAFQSKAELLDLP